jgi:two-component system, response regulator PdtaR
MSEVMVVEDEVVVSLQLEERLKSMGYTIVGCAGTGEESISMAKDLNPDVILTDIVMPGEIDGIDAAEIIRKELDIPVIYLTAWADEEYISRAKYTEPFGYIVKPFNEYEIRAMIEVALHRKGIERSKQGTEIVQKKNVAKETDAAHQHLLESILPVCSYCKKIRDEHNRWNEIDTYFHERCNVKFTHSICPDCTMILFPELDIRKLE